MPRYIKLTRFSTKSVNVQYHSGFNLFVQASMAVGMSDKVFVYCRLPPDPYNGNECDVFQTIAGPVDMEEWPEDAPDPSKPFAYFRKNTVDVVVRSTFEADRLWQTIKKEVCILVDALNRLDELKQVDEFWCPGMPPVIESDSADGGTDPVEPSSASSASSASSMESL